MEMSHDVLECKFCDHGSLRLPRFPDDVRLSLICGTVAPRVPQACSARHGPEHMLPLTETPAGRGLGATDYTCNDGLGALGGCLPASVQPVTVHAVKGTRSTQLIQRCEHSRGQKDCQRILVIRRTERSIRGLIQEKEDGSKGHFGDPTSHGVGVQRRKATASAHIGFHNRLAKQGPLST